jgi:Ammonium Transporter Family
MIRHCYSDRSNATPLYLLRLCSLSGLVAITAGCGVVEHWAAVVIGVVAGWAYMAADAALIKCKLDDAVSAIPVHLANGIWGVLAAGLFASPDLLQAAYGKDSHPGFFYAPLDSNLMPAQLVGILFMLGWTLVTMLPFFGCLNFLGWFRVNELEELVGLDASYHGCAPTTSLFDDESSNNPEARLAAYKQRFEERKQMRAKRTVKKMSVDELLNSSWGRVEFGGSDGHASTNGMSDIKDVPLSEQAPIKTRQTIEL